MDKPEQGSTPGRQPSSSFKRAVGRGSRVLARRVDEMFAAGGLGFRRLAESHVASVGGDTVVTIALAGSLFFQVPSNEARGNMALYLLLTLAPFVVLGPVLVAVFRRFPTAYRNGLAASTSLRVLLVLAMVISGLETAWLFPLAFALLVASRLHGISRTSLLPIVLHRPVELVGANARLARVGIVATVLMVPVGALAVWLANWVALVLAACVYSAGTWSGWQVPRIGSAAGIGPLPPQAERSTIPRGVRLARLATSGVRFLNGFLLLLVAFAFRDADAGVADFGALLGAAGFGFFLASLLAPWLERRLREEPMMVAALAIEAAAAFIAAQIFGLPAASALAAAAGLAWGTAKFGFDGLLQATVDPRGRGHAFTLSETVFQVAWVVGALLPVLLDIPIKLGLSFAGVIALLVQLLYISGLLLPAAEARARLVEPVTPEPEPARRDVTQYL